MEKNGKPTGNELEDVREDESPEATLPSDGGGGREFSFKEKDKAVWNWDEIGDKEEMYLANTYEELYELIMKKTIFKRKVGEKDIEKLKELFKSLLVYSRQNIEELQLLEQIQEEDEEDELDKLKRADYRRFTSLVSFQHGRMGWMVEELFSRCQEARGELRSSELRAKGLAEENGQLRERLEALARERNEVLGKLDSRRGDGKDASAPMEAEVSDVEMAEEHVPSMPQGIPQSLVGTLEAMIEKKMGEFLSRVGLSAEREGDNRVCPTNTGKALGRNGPENGTTPMAKSNKLWSEVAAKCEDKSLTHRDSVPVRGDKGRKGSQASAVPIDGGGPQTHLEEKGKEEEE